MEIFEVLRKSDERLYMRIPGVMKRKLFMDSKRLGIHPIKLVKYIIMALLRLDSEGQVSFLKSLGGENNKKPARKKRSSVSPKGQGSESENREVE